MEVYLVGGAVRDTLLGLPVAERDWVVVGATPQALLKAGYRQVGKDFPVFLHPDTREEYALARTERKTAPGYHGFAFDTGETVTLEDDLKRRDLTINAMAQRADGELIDPYGGQDDLAAGRLRHVSPAFAEDPVRVLRVARFAAQLGSFGFSVAHGTNALMRQMVADGEVDHLVPERVWAELHKALACKRPERFFTVLHGCHALARLFPEIEREYEHGDSAHGTNRLPAALDLLAHAAGESDNTRVRFATLLLALGADLDPAKRLAQADALCKRYRVPGEFSRLAATAIRLVQAAARGQAEDLLAIMEASGAFRETTRWAELLAVYRVSGRLGDAEVERFEKARVQAADINAASLDDPTLQGPAVGEAIRARRLAAVESVLAGD